MSWFDIFLALIVVLGFLRGFFTGFVKQISSLLGIVAGLLFAGRLAVKINPWLQQMTGSTSPRLIEAVSYVVAFFVILIIFSLIGLIIQKMLKLLQLSLIDRGAGSFLCAAKWIVIVSIILNVILMFDVNQRIIKPGVRQNSVFFPYIKSVTSYFIPFLDFGSEEEGQNPK